MEDKIDWESMYHLVNRIGIRGYRPQYFQECKLIWHQMVPEKGQAATVQGELLREIEKLRHEACNNGNINWDDNFAWFCDNVRRILTDSKLFDANECGMLKEILDDIKANGEYARKYAEGEISDEECDPVRLAYTDDDLYDYLADAAARFYLANKAPIPYEQKAFIYR